MSRTRAPPCRCLPYPRCIHRRVRVPGVHAEKFRLRPTECAASGKPKLGRRRCASRFRSPCADATTARPGLKLGCLREIVPCQTAGLLVPTWKYHTGPVSILNSPRGVAPGWGRREGKYVNSVNGRREWDYSARKCCWVGTRNNSCLSPAEGLLRNPPGDMRLPLARESPHVRKCR